MDINSRIAKKRIEAIILDNIEQLPTPIGCSVGSVIEKKRQ